MRHFFNAFLVTVFFSFLPLQALASEKSPQSEPSKLVMGTIAEVRSTVETNQELGDEVLTEKLEKIVFPMFNFNSMARLCLGKNWKKGSAEQQKEFTDLFAKLLSRTYLNRIRKIEQSKVTYTGEKIRKKRAIVKTIVTNDGQDFPIFYRLKNYDGTWQIYDVVVENISLVSNYREDFSGIIRRESFDGLIGRLRTKTSNSAAA